MPSNLVCLTLCPSGGSIFLRVLGLDYQPVHDIRFGSPLRGQFVQAEVDANTEGLRGCCVRVQVLLQPHEFGSALRREKPPLQKLLAGDWQRRLISLRPR